MRSKEKAFDHFDLSPSTLNKEAHDAVTGRRISNIGRELMEAAPDPGPTIDQAAECSTETVINGNASSNREWFEWFRPSLNSTLHAGSRVMSRTHVIKTFNCKKVNAPVLQQRTFPNSLRSACHQTEKNNIHEICGRLGSTIHWLLIKSADGSIVTCVNIEWLKCQRAFNQLAVQGV